MKTKILFIALLIFTLVASSVSADRYVDWQFKYATLDSTGITYTNTPITGVDNIGFVCADGSCNTVSGTLRGGATTSSGVTDTMQLTYPTADSSVETNGYGEYFYKSGYITWEQNPTFWGTNPADPAGPYDVYLSKIASCNAPVDNFNILNDVQPNVPLVIDIDASLDSITYAAISNAGPLGYTPAALADEFYSIDTEITLTITDWNGDIVFEQEQNVMIPFSSAAPVQFTWTPTIAGTYTAEVSTYVEDTKCLSSATQTTAKDFHVLSEDPRNMCYTILNGFATNDQFPEEGETLSITGTKISNYADDNYALYSVPTDLALTVTRTADGTVVYTDSTTLAANANAVVTQPFDFNWVIPALGQGWYELSVTGISNDAQCTGLPNLAETVYLDILVNAANVLAPTITGIPDVSVNENTMPPNNWIDLWSYASDDVLPASSLIYTIVSQTNSALISCSLDSNRYIDCAMPALNSFGFSDITIEVSDGFFTDRDTFRVSVMRVNDYPIITNIPNVNFEVGDYAELDLDDYVSDINYNDDQLTWTYTGDNVIQIDFDPITHIVRFESPVDEAVEQITFTVTNPDGLTASDISVATAFKDNSITLLNSLVIRAHVVGDDHMEAGDTLQLGVSVENVGSKDIDNVQMTAIVHSLDMRDKVGPFNVDGYELVSKRLYLFVPADAKEGTYDIRLTISNDDVRRVIYRQFDID